MSVITGSTGYQMCK